MKKTFLVWGLVLALMFGVGFGFPAEKAFAEASAQEPSDSFTADGSVIFEKDGVTVTTAGLDTDPTDGDDQPIVWIKSKTQVIRTPSSASPAVPSTIS